MIAKYLGEYARHGLVRDCAAKCCDSAIVLAQAVHKAALPQLNPNLTQLNPNLIQLNPNLIQLNPNLTQLNLTQLNPNLTQLNPNSRAAIYID